MVLREVGVVLLVVAVLAFAWGQHMLYRGKK